LQCREGRGVKAIRRLSEVMSVLRSLGVAGSRRIRKNPI
jgi:hypothetical protein